MVILPTKEKWISIHVSFAPDQCRSSPNNCSGLAAFDIAVVYRWEAGIATSPYIDFLSKYSITSRSPVIPENRVSDHGGGQMDAEHPPTKGRRITADRAVGDRGRGTVASDPTAKGGRIRSNRAVAHRGGRNIAHDPTTTNVRGISADRAAGDRRRVLGGVIPLCQYGVRHLG